MCALLRNGDARGVHAAVGSRARREKCGIRAVSAGRPGFGPAARIQACICRRGRGLISGQQPRFRWGPHIENHRRYGPLASVAKILAGGANALADVVARDLLT
jgi:hypothetical protein